jgi:hypothetical protein
MTTKRPPRIIDHLSGSWLTPPPLTDPLAELCRNVDGYYQLNGPDLGRWEFMADCLRMTIAEQPELIEEP